MGAAFGGGGDGGGRGGDEQMKSSIKDFFAAAKDTYQRRQRDRYVNVLSPVSGYSALHLAADKGLTETVGLLIDSGRGLHSPTSLLNLSCFGPSVSRFVFSLRRVTTHLSTEGTQGIPQECYDELRRGRV